MQDALLLLACESRVRKLGYIPYASLYGPFRQVAVSHDCKPSIGKTVLCVLFQ
jgi:hypothetical protein